MSITVFAAAGFVFAVNNKNGNVVQMTAIEALICSDSLNSLGTTAFIDFVLSEDENCLEEATGYQKLADAFEVAALESVLG